MKKRIFLLVIIFTMMIFIPSVNAAKNPYKKTTKWGTNCTWYAWQQAHDKAGVNLPGWGNARTWYNSAKKAGFEVSKTPKAKSIVVWEWDKYGHVGYVERVKGDKIYVWHSDKTCIDENDKEFKECMDKAMQIDQSAQEKCYTQYAKPIACEYDASYWSEPGDLIGYIYLDSAPKATKKITASTTTKTTTKKTTSTLTTTLNKSSDTSLSELLINDKLISVEKEKTTYTLEVPYEVEKANIKIKATDEKAKVEEVNEQALTVGENNISFKVTAEDDTATQYQLMITRKEKEKQEETTIKEEKQKPMKQWTNYLMIGGFVLIFIGIILLLIYTGKLRKAEE